MPARAENQLKLDVKQGQDIMSTRGWNARNAALACKIRAPTEELVCELSAFDLSILIGV